MSSKEAIHQKAVQNPETYHSDFLSAPIDNDMALATWFDWKSSWCYLNNCNNNIYKGLKKKESKITKTCWNSCNDKLCIQHSSNPTSVGWNREDLRFSFLRLSIIKKWPQGAEAQLVKWLGGWVLGVGGCRGQTPRTALALCFSWRFERAELVNNQSNYFHFLIEKFPLF